MRMEPIYKPDITQKNFDKKNVEAEQPDRSDALQEHLRELRDPETHEMF